MAELIRIWAPASDGNNTKAYIAQVKQRSNIQPSEVILTHDRGFMSRLCRAMAEVENGISQPLSLYEQAFDIL